VFRKIVYCSPIEGLIHWAGKPLENVVATRELYSGGFDGGKYSDTATTNAQGQFKFAVVEERRFLRPDLLSANPHVSQAMEGISNEDFATHESRHVITRCFRPGRLCEVEITPHPIQKNDKLIIATDGYWADLDAEEKASFLGENPVLPELPQDDTSCWLLSPFAEGKEASQNCTGNENFYFVKHPQ